MNRVRKSIVWQLVIPIPTILFVAILAVWITIPRIVENNAHKNAVLAATGTANQFNVLRSYYTKNVAAKVLKDGNLQLSANHKNEPKSIPLPATVIHDMGALLGQENTTIELYSPYPFPNRRARILDDFQQQAWDALVANPDQVFTRRETRNGVEVVRVAIADRMVAESCVSCHNGRPDTPKADWKIGDVRGVLEVAVGVSGQLAAGATLGNMIVLVATLGGGLLIGICVLTARRVTAPLIRMTHAMDRLSEGDLDTDIPELHRADEVGAMARSLEVFKDHAFRVRETKSTLEKEIRHRELYEEKLRNAQLKLEERVAERTQNLSEEVARRRQTQDQLSEAIENMSEGFAIYDADDRLVLCNSRNREFYAESADLFVTGAHIEEIVRAGIARGQYIGTTGGAEDWIAWRLDRFRNPRGAFVENLSNGNWVQISEHKTKDGRTICVRTDITEQKMREQDLADKSKQLEAVLENMDQGISMADSDLNVVVFNQRFLEMQEFPLDKFRRGDPFEAFIRFNAERGDYGAGDVERQVRAQVELVTGSESHRFERTRADGTVIEIRGNAVPGGGFVTIYSDITDLKSREKELRESETKIRSILDNTADSIITIDEKGVVETFNREAERCFGYEASEIIGRNISVLMSEPDAAHHDGYLKRYLDGGDGKVVGMRREVACRRKNGTAFPADLAVGRVCLGERCMFVGIINDVTERKRTETALIVSQQRLSAIADNLFESVLVVDPNGHIVFANRTAEALLSCSGGKLAGRDLDMVVRLRLGSKEVSFADSPFRKVAATGTTASDDEAVFVASDGSTLDIAFGCSPLLEDAKPRGAIISFRDIRELKAARDEMLQASKFASVGQLAAGIAHEINTPAQYIGDNLRFLSKSHEDIAAILHAYAELAQAARKSQVLEDLVAKVNIAMEEADLEYLLEEIPSATEQSLGGIEQVSGIVLAMKEFSHPGTGEKTATDLNRAVENTLTVCRNEWKDVAEADIRLDPALPLVTCRPGQMNQVFLNLIVNAAHAIAAVGPEEKGRITVETKGDGDWVEIRIADTGGGIPKEIRERIFDPFFTTKEVGKGTGQGLAICRDVVVDKHGGKIFNEPGPESGTVFVVRIPVDGLGREPKAA